ncbi:MAG: DnaJ domain-containing protein, partial [Candidatus Aminicenantes bacterium]|nr:DnaJ domain-containing protein [Candidatus Aminicenantes bacterium]
MSISSSVYPIPLTIKNILTDGFNGELVIKGKDLNKSLFFEDGDLIYAKSDIFDERINVILYLLGKISDQQYEYITGLGQSVDLEVGRILIENNFITEDDLFYTTLFQIRKIAVNAFKINQADWELREGNMETPLKQKHRIPLPPIIVEGARKIENISFFMNKIQFLSPRTTEIPAPLNQLMAGDEIVLYKRLHDCKKMSNHEIISKLNLDPVFYWRTLVLFILLDVIDFSKHRLNYDMEEDIHRLIKFQKKLMNGKSNPFEILRIPVSASRSEVKVAFFKLSKIFHPDRFGSAAAPEIKKIARYVFWEIENSYHSLTKKLKKSVAKKEKEKKEGRGEMDFQPEYQQEIEINLENDLNGDEQESVESSEIEIQMNIQDEISMEADNLDSLGEKEAGPYIKPDQAEEKESIQTGVLETREIITEDQENKNSPEELPVQEPSVYERAEKYYT